MKKMLLVTILCFFLTTGCTKKLTCEKVQETSLATTREILLVTYKNNQVNSIQIDLNTQVDSKYGEKIETVEKNLKEQFSKYENKKGISLTSNSSDNIVNIHLYIELSKMSKKEQKNLNFINLEENYDTLKKTLEQKKYQCR